MLDLHSGSAGSDAAGDLRFGGYDLAHGKHVDFSGWYTPAYPDLTILFMTRISSGFGVIWGLGTGERGAKYRVAPSAHLGFILQTHPFDGATLSVSGIHVLGGGMREKPCIADYGVIGGVGKVNCRLAAGLLPPAETLSYLVDVAGWQDDRISMTFEYRF
ncbi:hypothetical protein [Paracoccus sp. (in: a-proteobacteria)]|uniref:hypothetical protein n=1 Tax=Paracoccus sp. TaxID=267 RepID=UPI003A857178